jgi:hypothetical protein
MNRSDDSASERPEGLRAMRGPNDLTDADMNTRG